MLEVKLIGVHRISCPEPNSFDPEDIDRAAQAILTSQGLISPLIVKLDRVEMGRSSYTVVDGTLQYYAAVKACEIDPVKGESVQAIILDPELEISLDEQIQLFRKIEQRIINDGGQNDNTNATLTRLQHSLQEANELIQRMRQIEEKLAQMIAHDAPAVTPDPELGKNLISELFSNLANGSVEVVIRKPQEEPIDISSHVTPLKMFNELSKEKLMKAIRKAGIANATAQTLTTNFLKARSEAPFASYTDVVSRTKQLGDKRMLQILDSWSGFN